MTESKIKVNNIRQPNNEFKINMYFDKDGQPLQKVMENNLVIYYAKAINSK